MGLTWEFGGVDKSATVRWTEWDLTEYAYRGQVGTGVVVIDDADGTYTPPGQKQLAVTNTWAGSNSRLFTGFVAERTAELGRAVPGGREWRVTVEDANVLIDDRVFTGSEANRPEETDYQRITWLLTTGAMTNINAGFVPNTDTETMDAVDYRGKKPRDVLEDCAQRTGKNFFIYHVGAGYRLFYDLSTGSNFTSTLTITDDATAVNNTTHFAPYNVSSTLDPSRVYSRVRLRYKGGSYTTAENATTEANYRRREVYRRYMRAKTATKAQAQATKWLAQAAEEQTTLSLSVDIPAAYINSIRAGMRVQVQLSRYDINTYYRIVRRTIRQVTDDVYGLDLEFEDKTRPTAFQGGPVDNPDGEETSNGTDDDATVVIDASGITVTNGRISVTNGSGTVIIDGTSDFFSIVASGTLTIPQTSLKGQTYQSIMVTTGLEFDPSTLFFSNVPSSDGKGNWSQPTPVMELSASGTILRMIHGRARHVTGTAGASAKTQVQVMRFSTLTSDGPVRVRYYILQKTAF